MNEIQEHRDICEGIKDSLISKGYFAHNTYNPNGCDVMIYGGYEDGVFSDRLMVIAVPHLPARQEAGA